jgi:hypothetical protein
VKSCLASEQRTREELTKNWSNFPAEDRIGCVKSLTFSPTYTELVTCLEMRRDVKKLRDAKPADTNPRRWPQDVLVELADQISKGDCAIAGHQ